jgi:hypothetical protein
MEKREYEPYNQSTYSLLNILTPSTVKDITETVSHLYLNILLVIFDQYLDLEEYQP